MTTTEQIHFRYLQMPCCRTQLCWVNPRLPSYCPECGQMVYPAVKGAIVYEDKQAVLSYSQEKPT